MDFDGSDRSLNDARSSSRSSHVGSTTHYTFQTFQSPNSSVSSTSTTAQAPTSLDLRLGPPLDEVLKRHPSAVLPTTNFGSGEPVSLPPHPPSALLHQQPPYLTHSSLISHLPPSTLQSHIQHSSLQPQLPPSFNSIHSSNQYPSYQSSIHPSRQDVSTSVHPPVAYSVLPEGMNHSLPPQSSNQSSSFSVSYHHSAVPAPSLHPVTAPTSSSLHHGGTAPAQSSTVPHGIAPIPLLPHGALPAQSLPHGAAPPAPSLHYGSASVPSLPHGVAPVSSLHHSTPTASPAINPCHSITVQVGLSTRCLSLYPLI